MTSAASASAGPPAVTVAVEQPPQQRWPLLRGLVAISLAVLLLLALLWPPPALGLPEAPAGATLFENHCAGCHVQGGNIIRRRQTLKLEALQRNGLADPAAIAAVAAAGRGQMSGYGEVLGADGVEAVAAWVWQQAQLGWPRS